MGSGRGRTTDDAVFGAARFGSERGRGAGSNFGSGALATGGNGAGGGDTAGGVGGDVSGAGGGGTGGVGSKLGNDDSLNRNAIRGGISGFAARGGSPRNTIDPA